MFRLVVTQTNGKELEFWAEGETLHIGRAPLVNDICIEDPSISRQHAKIQLKKDHLWITDLDSQNGVLIEGARTAKSELSIGQAVYLGNVKIEVFVENQAIKLERITKTATREGEILLRPIEDTTSSQNLGKDTLTEADNLMADIPSQK